jgi:hypothetical protein
MRLRPMTLTVALSLAALLGGVRRAPGAEDKKPPRQLAGTLEKVDLKKGTVTLAIPHPLDGAKVRIRGLEKLKGVTFHVMKPQTHELARKVKATIGGAAARLADVEKVSRAAQEPAPGCGCRHGVKAVVKLAADGKSVTEVNVLEVTNELLAVDVKKGTVTLAVPDYLRPPLEMTLGGEAKGGQPKLILSFSKRQTFELGKKVKITLDGKVARLADLKKVSKEAGKPDPRCGCTPPGATVTLVLSDDGKKVTDITVQPRPKAEAGPKK